MKRRRINRCQRMGEASHSGRSLYFVPEGIIASPSWYLSISRQERRPRWKCA
jgi:hypothetical protein